MINRVVIVGRLTKDPELRYTPSGLATVRFVVAVNRNFANQNGEKEADFISCVAWRKQAENLANFQKKGNLVGLEGRIQTGSYEGSDGKRVYTTDVVCDSIQFLEHKNQENQQPHQQNYNQQPQQQNYNQQPQQQNYNQASQQQNYNQQPKQNNQTNFNAPGNAFTNGPGSEEPFVSSNNYNNQNKGPVKVSEDDLPF